MMLPTLFVLTKVFVEVIIFLSDFSKKKKKLFELDYLVSISH